MPSLDDLRKRIKSVKSTQKITKAMKMVAAAKLRKAQENAEKGRPYSEKMNNIILNLSNSIIDKENAPKLLAGTGKEKIHLCIMLTADRGLCGGFNTNIVKKAKSFFEKIKSEGKNLKIITVGNKGHDQLKRAYGKEIIEISEDQLENFSGNMLQLKDSGGNPILVMSESAHKALNKLQIDKIQKHCNLLYSPIPTIERCGGGSVRCMIAEVFLPISK